MYINIILNNQEKFIIIQRLYVIKKLKYFYIIEMTNSILENFKFSKKLFLNLKFELGFYE